MREITPDAQMNYSLYSLSASFCQLPLIMCVCVYVGVLTALEGVMPISRDEKAGVVRCGVRKSRHCSMMGQLGLYPACAWVGGLCVRV